MERESGRANLVQKSDMLTLLRSSQVWIKNQETSCREMAGRANTLEKSMTPASTSHQGLGHSTAVLSCRPAFGQLLCIKDDAGRGLVGSIRMF